MSDETLLSAARRVVRFFGIDESHGGLTSTPTIQAVLTLHNQVILEDARLKLLHPDEPSPSTDDTRQRADKEVTP